MSSIRLVINQVSISSYGHMQLVFDSDGIWDNGDETEIEVQGALFGDSNWDVSPEQSYVVGGTSSPDEYLLTLTPDQDAASVWGLLLNARTFFATQTTVYHLGLSGPEGQNSNTYINTLAHIVGLDLVDEIDDFMDNFYVNDLPGVLRNVLFDHIDVNEAPLPPVALTLQGTSHHDQINGGAGADVFYGANGDDLLRGYGGDDQLTGGSGADTMIGDAGNDTMFGGFGRDILHGDQGDDILNGQNGNDNIFGGDGADTLIGRSGADSLFGGLLNDTLNGGDGNDVLNGGAGEDDIFGQSGNDTANGGGGHDRILGGDGDDILNGMAGNDVIYGNQDNDTVDGGAGNDQLFGNAGDDTITGGLGNDRMSGGPGTDTFVFNGALDEGHDSVTDFALGVDEIEISGANAGNVTISGGVNTLITLDSGTEIRLFGVASADFDVGDIMFV